MRETTRPNDKQQGVRRDYKLSSFRHGFHSTEFTAIPKSTFTHRIVWQQVKQWGRSKVLMHKRLLNQSLISTTTTLGSVSVILTDRKIKTHCCLRALWVKCTQAHVWKLFWMSHKCQCFQQQWLKKMGEIITDCQQWVCFSYLSWAELLCTCCSIWYLALHFSCCPQVTLIQPTNIEM